jgi:hypothetical protein
VAGVATSFVAAVKAPEAPKGPKAPAGFHWVKDHWERNIAAVPVPAVPTAAAAVALAPTSADTIFGLPKKLVFLGGAAAVGLVVYFKFFRKKKP